MVNIEKEKNKDQNHLLISSVQRHIEKIKKGGGNKKIEKLHQQGKLTARERIRYLIDENTEFYELGTFAAFEMYQEYGGCPSAGVVMGIGKVAGRRVILVANDATVKAGAWFPMTCKKNLRAQEIAIENRLPIIYLVDSAGVFLPMQDEIFPDKEHFGRIFRNNARLSSMGIPQISAVMGSCVAGGAYLPIMSDEALIVKGTGSIFLAGPYLVKAAIGENVDKETLGGAETHSEISGVTDYIAESDKDCLDQIKSIMGNMGILTKSHLERSNPVSPSLHSKTLLEEFPEHRTTPYDSYRILNSIIDSDTFTEYKAKYGKTIICGYAKIDGWHVGIVMNNRSRIKTKKGEMQFGGVIYSDSADKATRFILNCNQKKIPLVFLHDVTGFMVGSRSEHGGIIKDGAKMVNAVANSTVPKISVIMGNSNGAGNYAMCGKAYDPRFIFAWPMAQIAVMGGEQAAKVLLQIEQSKQDYNEEESNKRLEELKKKYADETSAYYAAARLWVDEIIDPEKTRDWISLSLEVAQNSEIEKFNPGVIQT
ncbi:acyl-CoA carboxylase subunit beta [Membranihabitans maritimus]|uniref:acyl-CoA carboxylase subunit beta n=1 Tax=Membranihabitans maritimus TaxID=2904244 RepID=UPI001F41AB81|nr:acyl-CoA carboxylase subunit beta [Membranihabitans maritimus]